MTSKSGPSSTSADTAELLGQVHRQHWGRLIALLVVKTRRIDLVEDALGEAFARAARGWPGDGAPANPAGWLYTTAYRHLVGRLRSEAVAGRTAARLAARPDAAHGSGDVAEALPDERLQLILLCCHPALGAESRAPLALRLVIGTATHEIARLFLVPRDTMAARITRAKQRIVAAGIPLSRPVADELAARLDEVCRTIYLAFTAGYTPGSGTELLRPDLAGEAVELAVVLQQVVPDAPQVTALLALLQFQHARRDARMTDGRLVTLADQDRTLWRHDEIASASRHLFSLSPTTGYAESLRRQALIAAEHGRAATASATDWAAISAHYAALAALTGSPVVRLNQAVAVAEVEGPQAALALLDGLDELLPTSHRLPAVRADLLRRLGQLDAAAACYDLAIERCDNDVERAFLVERRP